jgi:hypothetical protein
MILKERCASLRHSAAVAAFVLAIPWVNVAQAQSSDPNAAQTAEKARLDAETARINAEAARINAEAARDRARIDALRLPSFEGTTTLGQGAGAMEATILASHTVRRAASLIGASVDQAYPETDSGAPPIVVLAGDEAIDFGRIGALGAEMDAIHAEFERLIAIDRAANPRQPLFTSDGETGGSATAIISAVTAAAGLLRSNTDVTALDLPAISNRVLATAVAAELGARAILPSAAVGSITPAPPTDQWIQMSLIQKLNRLVALRAFVEAARNRIPVADPSKPTQAEKDKIAPYTAALARFDAFAARVTTADTSGSVPLVQAARLESIWRLDPRILRVYVDRAGGSVIRRTNIATTLALDSPVRVSGAMVASYTLTNPATGNVLAAEIITCRTAIGRLREVQQGVWRNRPTTAEQEAQCAPA